MDDKRRFELIDALTEAVTGEGAKRPGEESGIGIRFEKSTGTVKFLLSGTEYTISQVAEAGDYFKALAESKSGAGASEKMHNEVAYICISEIIRQFNSANSTPSAE